MCRPIHIQCIHHCILYNSKKKNKGMIYLNLRCIHYILYAIQLYTVYTYEGYCAMADVSVMHYTHAPTINSFPL